jgi:uncharacterized membrane protein YeaQ/YmgE (transglycosylase-associated protein family)
MTNPFRRGAERDSNPMLTFAFLHGELSSRATTRRRFVHVVGFVLFGLVIGVVARMLVGGKSPGGWGPSMVSGAVGAMLGGFFGRFAGLYHDREPAGFVMALLGAFALVAVYHVARRRRARA